MSADRFPEPVAIVGMSGCFSGARDLRQYWQNIVDGVDAIGEADAEWLGPYFDPESKENDRIYFLRFLDHGLKGKTAPLDVARDQITELLLQKRRQQLREALRDTLLQRAWAEGDLRRENL